MRKIDLTGHVFGRLTVVGRAPENNKFRQAMWICRCSCPDHTVILVPTLSLKTGNTKSCGCLQREVARETMTKWESDEEREIISRFDKMKQRCYNSHEQKWKNYGGRGIYICDEWLKDPTKFVKWSKENGFNPEASIDRIDNDGPYAPWNCRWTDSKTQANNRSSNVLITVNGITHNLKQWATMLCIPYDTIGRIRRLEGDDALVSYLSNQLNQV